MKRLRYKDIAGYAFLLLLAAVCCQVFVLSQGVFGAKVDWISQHSVFPDYFRKQFYETGEMFPEFALGIGGGQNIYHFSYYGLYSPVVLVSYLLPFVKMSDYMMAAQFVCLAASVMLLYRWLLGRGVHKGTALVTAVIFLLSGPMIYHSYKQIMFVNYMPFLCMGFLGTDRYFDGMKRGEKRHQVLLLFSVFLMILTSFYFSIGGMLVLILYGIYRYFEVCQEKRQSVTFQSFLQEGIRFLVPFLLAVLMSGVLLVPTAMALAGRGGAGHAFTFRELFVPQFLPRRFFYSPYGIGLSGLGTIALTAMLSFPRRHEKILAWGCFLLLTVPAAACLLNGGLYIRDKAVIPFLPLLCYIIAYYVERTQPRFLWTGMIPYMAVLVIFLWSQKEAGQYKNWILLDIAVMAACFAIFYMKRNSLILLVPAAVFLFVFGMAFHSRENCAADREFYEEVTDGDAGRLIAETAEEENGFFRIEQWGTDEENAANLNRVWDMGQYVSSIYSSSYCTDYQEFRKDIFSLEQPFRNALMQSSVQNPVFLRFMGVKYVLSKEKLPGYKAIKRKGAWTVYENQGTLPAAYGTDRIMPEEEYETLEFPYNQLALLSYAVVGEEKAAVGSGLPDESKETKDKKALEDAFCVQQIEITLPGKIMSDKNQKLEVRMPQMPEQGVVFLQFDVRNLKPSQDVAVCAGGTRNKLTAGKHFYYNDNTTFTYAVLMEQGQDKLELMFGEGEYEISNVKCLTGKLKKEDGTLCQAEFCLDKKDTRGNVIAGKVEMKNPGYLITSIPYDKNFEIQIDGKRVRGETVNKAFLGCAAGAGKHEIRILYHAPGATVGEILSAAGALLSAIFLWRRGIVHTQCI